MVLFIYYLPVQYLETDRFSKICTYDTCLKRFLANTHHDKLINVHGITKEYILENLKMVLLTFRQS